VIVLYDEDCGFCRWTIGWALERDCDRVLEVTPIQSPMGERLLAGMEPAGRLRSMHVVHADYRSESGGAAVREVLEVLPSARALAWLAGISPGLTQRAYRLIAEHRSRLSRLVPRGAKLKADDLLASDGRRRAPSARRERPA
jgi:predicted DCC family thiol-disulfide oxidoreductase YuxK